MVYASNPHSPAHAFPINNVPHNAYALKAQKDAEEMANRLSAMANVNNTIMQGMVIDRLMRDHRTLQQSMTRFCFFYIARMADQDFDLRNQAAVRLCQNIMCATTPENHNLPLI